MFFEQAFRSREGLLPYDLPDGTNSQRHERREAGKKLVPDVIFWYQFSVTSSRE